MRVPLSWLREFVDFEMLPEGLAERLTLLGMEVQSIERIGSDWSSVVVGELLEVQRHPSAGRLSLTRVRTGEGQPELSIVCGATNIEAGQRVPVAMPGARLPGDRSIEVSRIAGVESQGMLCSGAELGVTSDADGILILPAGSQLGAPLSDLLGDVVLDVDVKPNRGDVLSMVGVAREVAAAVGTTARGPHVQVPESGDTSSERVRVEVQDPLRCPRLVARFVDGITVGPSPMEVQVRLMAAGVRPISNVVDASNYVMLELGKPTHTFDAAHVAEGRLVVRGAHPGERLETLDHVRRELDVDTLVIADASEPLAIAGIMGGARSEVGPETRAVIIESAIFDPVAIRRTAKRYGLRSEASLRFEKGQEPRMARLGADRAAQLIIRWSGGRAAIGVVDTDPLEAPLVRIGFRPRRVSRLLGTEMSTSEMAELLGREGIATENATVDDVVPVTATERPIPLDEPGATDALVAVIPGHRRDLVIEADIAEEVARMHGYDRFPSRLPDTVMPPFHDDPRRAVDAVRDLLSGRGLAEVVTLSLVSPEDHAALGYAPGDPSTIHAANPVSSDHSELRRSLFPGLVRCLVDNERQRREDVAIFEVGPVHSWLQGEPAEEPLLGILLAGPATPPSWDRPARAWDVADSKGLISWLVGRVGQGRVRFELGAAREEVEHPGRTALVIVELQAGHFIELGRVGELDPRYLERAGARSKRAVVATIKMSGLALLRPGQPRAWRLERTPGADRDIAVVVDASRPAGEVEALVHAAGGPYLRGVHLFDRYEGVPLADGEVSLAYSLRFEPGEGALEEDDADRAVEAIVATLRERLGARLRG